MKIDPYRDSPELRKCLTSWLEKDATSDQVVRIASDVAPSSILDNAVSLTTPSGNEPHLSWEGRAAMNIKDAIPKRIRSFCPSTESMAAIIRAHYSSAIQSQAASVAGHVMQARRCAAAEADQAGQE